MKAHIGFPNWHWGQEIRSISLGYISYLYIFRSYLAVKVISAI